MNEMFINGDLYIIGKFTVKEMNFKKVKLSYKNGYNENIPIKDISMTSEELLSYSNTNIKVARSIIFKN